MTHSAPPPYPPGSGGQLLDHCKDTKKTNQCALFTTPGKVCKKFKTSPGKLSFELHYYQSGGNNKKSYELSKDYTQKMNPCALRESREKFGKSSKLFPKSCFCVLTVRCHHEQEKVRAPRPTHNPGRAVCWGLSASLRVPRLTVRGASLPRTTFPAASRDTWRTTTFCAKLLFAKLVTRTHDLENGWEGESRLQLKQYNTLILSFNLLFANVNM
ncbi:hypothetical protein CDAR_35821 [Caerostris darwini]|uniref:Uncharacterized protein n=1 Tax=Caerostris darwini TaxID=1538125 RepID=A0AAV4VE04_9ARAC|nr:hypothetical protein CDAR_35821 [Caerostris darwini]